jgi:Pyruvate/2-oxoacid:ferredoxin oxidoreductase delta subunit
MRAVELHPRNKRFLVREQCRKCSGCREGSDRIPRIVDNLADGRGAEHDIALLEGLGRSIREASLCLQGANAANPVLSSIKHFADEYRAHAVEKRCPDGGCRSLLTFSVDADRRNGCQSCARECPQLAISGRKMKPHSIDQRKCNKCMICLESCEVEAILVS